MLVIEWLQVNFLLTKLNFTGTLIGGGDPHMRIFVCRLDINLMSLLTFNKYHFWFEIKKIDIDKYTNIYIDVCEVGEKGHSFFET